MGNSEDEVEPGPTDDVLSRWLGQRRAATAPERMGVDADEPAAGTPLKDRLSAKRAAQSSQREDDDEATRCRLLAERRAASEAQAQEERREPLLAEAQHAASLLEETHAESQDVDPRRAGMARLFEQLTGSPHTGRSGPSEDERRAAEEAARVEAERRAAEEAARLEAEHREAERERAARHAAEEAARHAAEEAARLKAERRVVEERPATATGRRHNRETVAPPPLYHFKRRRRTQHVLALTTLASTALMALVSYRVFLTQSTTNYGITVIAGALTLVVWSLWWTSSPPRLWVVDGLLHVDTTGELQTFDLHSPYLGVTVVPRRAWRRWKVMLKRHGQPPYTVNAAIVKPRDFMRVLRYYRRDL